jgi:chorismate mutase-like protein
MSEQKNDLDDLRREIDEIDDRLQDLLIQRTDVVQRIAAFKRGAGGGAMRPEREANILRRLIGRHRGAFPATVVGRIWREIIAALTHTQAPFAVALHSLHSPLDHFDLARNHFGASRIDIYDTPGQALRAIAESAGQVVGVLPLPAGDDEVWWPLLAATDAARPRIIARLPFVRDAQAPVEGVVVAPFEPGASGDDASYLIIVTGDRTEISRGRLTDRLAAAGLIGQCIDSRQRGGDVLHLFEIDGVLEDHDPRLKTLLANHGEEILQAIVAGGYARPIEIPRH